MPSLHFAVAPLGGFDSFTVFAAGGVILLAAELDAMFDVLLAAIFDAVLDAIFDIVLVLMFDVVFIFEAMFVFFIAFELFTFVAAPPQANVKAISERSVIESNSLFFIY